jgi:hypothetical protein
MIARRVARWFDSTGLLLDFIVVKLDKIVTREKFANH